MERSQFDQMKLVSSLMKIGHGDLALYADAGLSAASGDPALFAHFVAWNHANSEVRDGKVAFPIIALRGTYNYELADNAVAHMMSLGPREFHRAILFHKALTAQGRAVRTGNGRRVKDAHTAYVRHREANYPWWERTVVRNRKAMTALYCLGHVRPAPWAQAILFDHKYPQGSTFEAIRDLRTMTGVEAAGTILEHKIPFQVAVGACPTIKDPSVLLALIEGMTGNEVIKSSKALKRLGVMDDPVLKLAYDEALARAKKDRRVGTLTAQTAAEQMAGEDRERMVALAEEKIDEKGHIDGAWAILGDRSDSMTQSIDLSREIAATVARFAEEAHLVFFNTRPHYIGDVAGMTLDAIKRESRFVYSEGGTSIGCGLELLADKGISLNGVIIVSDGGQRQPPGFPMAYLRYTRKTGLDPIVHFFQVPGYDPDWLSAPFERATGDTMVKWVLGEDVDRVSLPNVIRALKGSRFGLLDEIMGTPLLTTDRVVARWRARRNENRKEVTT